VILPIIISIIILVFAASLFVIIKYNKFENKVFRILGVLLFLVYLIRLFSKDVFDQTFNIFLIDIVTQIDAPTTWLFDPMTSFMIIILRWLTVITIAWIFVGVIYKVRLLKWLVSTLGFITIVLNIIFFNQHMIAFQGNLDITFRTYQYAIETGLTLVISLLSLVSLIKNKESLSFKKDSLNILLIILGSLFALMPLYFLESTVGYYGASPKDFNLEHLFVIIVPFVLMVICYRIFKTKTQHAKDAFIAFLAVAAVFEYFYLRISFEDYAAWPFHLCNAAVILMFFGGFFKIKSLIYFGYFANVFGAIAGIMLPNYEVDFFTIRVIHFGFNHMYALIIPILAIGFGTFPRPKLSSMYRALIVFTVYYLVVNFLNAWFNNWTEVNYFFTYGDFLPEMFGALDLKYQNVISFEFAGLTFKFYWLYQLILYLAFIFFMFASWYVYDLGFVSIENKRNLRNKLKQMKQDHLTLLENLDGRKLEDPMDEKGVGMIKIINFSKRYGKSSRYAVKNFSLEVAPGEIFGFLGHNGAGKSTTIKSMVGIQSITEGEIFLDGYSIKTQPVEAKLRIGYVSDNHAVYEKLTGREYIHYVADLYRVPKEVRDQRLEELLQKLSLAHAIDQEVKSYSHGMKQKLVVIASLIHEPPIWILDEPLTGLDPTSAYQIKESMKEHAAKGNIVFFSSHVIEVVEKICTKIAVINQGQLMGVYEMEELREKGISIESLYMSGIKDKSK